MILKKIQKTIKRHPFLYLTRFRLLSKNSDLKEIEGLSYNDLNSKEDIPAYFYEINQQIFKENRPTTDFEKVKQLSLWLNDHIKGGPGLSEPSDTALHTMLTSKGGVCSDVAQIFNNFCVINDLSVREWGTTSAPFNRAFGGHSFNEVYCKELNKWVLVDVYWCFFFYNEQQIPLSVVELYQLKRDNKVIEYEPFCLQKKVEETTVQKNYLNPNIIPFLICDYRLDNQTIYLRA